MKKLFLIIITSLVVMLSACHKGKTINEFVMPDSFDENKTYEITFWSKHDTNEAQKKIYEDAIVKFNTYYPNIHVNITAYTNYEDIYKDVSKNMATNTLPNVCITYLDYVATYLNKDNIIVPLDELMNHSDYGLNGSKIKFDSVKKENIYEKFLNEGKYLGSYYTLPFMRSTEATYINKTYVEYLGFEIPEYLTWDFIWQVSEKAMEERKKCNVPEGYNTTVDNFIPCIYKSVDNQMITMLKQYGYDYTTENGEILFFNDNTKDILMDLADKREKGYFDIFNNVSYPGDFFNQGNCIFAIDSTAGATWMGTESPQLDISEDELKQMDTVVRTVPQVNDNFQMISQGPSVCIFNKENSDEVMASWIFVNFLLTDYVQIRYSQTEGYIPVTKCAIESDSYQKYLEFSGHSNYDGFDASISASNLYINPKNRSFSPSAFFYQVKIEAVKMLIENIDHSFITPVFNGSIKARQAAGDLIARTMKEHNVTKEKLSNIYQIVKSLNRIDEIQSASGSVARKKVEFEKLDRGAIVLLVLIPLAWVIMIIYIIIRRRRQNNLKR